jgi:hypothetical protein
MAFFKKRKKTLLAASHNLFPSPPYCHHCPDAGTEGLFSLATYTKQKGVEMENN